MAVHHGHDFGPRAVDLAVDVALDEALALVAAQRLAVGVEPIRSAAVTSAGARERDMMKRSGRLSLRALMWP